MLRRKERGFTHKKSVSNYESISYIKENSQRQEAMNESGSKKMNRESSVPAPRTGKKIDKKVYQRRDSSAKRQINLKDYKMRTAKDLKFARIRLQNLFAEPKNRFGARKGTSYYKNQQNNSNYYSTIEKGERSLAQGYISKKMNSQIVCLDRSLQGGQTHMKGSKGVLNSTIAHDKSRHKISINRRKSDNVTDKDSPIFVNKDIGLKTIGMDNRNKSSNLGALEELRYGEKQQQQQQQTVREGSGSKRVSEVRLGYQSSLRNLLAKPKKSGLNLASKKAVDRSILQMSLLENMYGGTGVNKVTQSWAHHTMGSFYKGKEEEMLKGGEERVRETSSGPKNKGILKRKIRLAEYFNLK